MAVGKGSIKRAAKAAEASTVAAPAKEVVEAIVEKAPAEKKPAAKKTAAKKPAAKNAPAKKAPAKQEEVKEVKTVGIGTDLPAYLL